MRPLLLLLAFVAVLAGLGLLVFWRPAGDASEPALEGSVPAESVVADSPVEAARPGALPLARAQSRAEIDAVVEAGGMRIDGEVVMTSGCPAEDGLEVFALRESTDYGTFLRRALATDGDRVAEWEASLLARAPVLPGGGFTLAVPGDESLDQVHLMARGRHLFLPETEPFAPGGTVVLEPTAGARLVGTVLAPQGTSLAELEVSVRSASEDLDPRARDQRTRLRLKLPLDTAGRFELGAVPLASYDLAIEPETLAAIYDTVSDLVACSERTVELVLVPGAEIVGRVLDDRGRGVPGAEVAALVRGRFFGFDDRPAREAETDADGAFRLTAVIAGELSLRASKLGFLESAKVTVEVPAEGRVEGISLQLREGRSIAGRVSWPDGRGAADVRVRVGFDPSQMTGPGALGMFSGAKSAGRTDSTGGFRVSGLGAGPFVVFAAARPEVPESPEVPENEVEPPLWSVTLDGVRPGAEGLELVLHPPLTIAGRVLDDGGAPLSSFRIEGLRVVEGLPPLRELAELDFDDEDNRFGFMGGGLVTASFEDERGLFTLECREAGTWRLEAESEGWVTVDPVSVTVPAGTPVEGVEIRLAPTAAVSGIVRTHDGAPAAGATVSVQTGGPPAFAVATSDHRPSARSDESGRFRLADLAPGRTELVADATFAARSASVFVELPPGGEVEGVELALTRGGTLTGEVYALGGERAKGSLVSLTSLTTMESHAVVTDAVGEFTVEHLEPGSWQVVAIETASDWTGESGEVDLGSIMSSFRMATADIVEGETTHVVVGAPPEQPVHVHGKVTHAGAPFEGAAVSFFPEGPQALQRMGLASVQKDGSYSIDLDGPGAYVVSVQRLGSQAGQQQTVEYSVEVPETADHRLDFALPLGRISGIATGPSGAPAARARITLAVDGGTRTDSLMGGQFVEVQADDEGRYDLVALRPGTYRLSAGGPPLVDIGGRAPAFGRVTLGGLQLDEGEWKRDVELRLPTPGTLGVHVVGTSGEPAAGAAIFVRDADGRVVEPLSFRSSDTSGLCSYTGLAPGRYSAFTRSGELASVESALVQVREGETADVELVLEPGAILWIRVQDGDGEPTRAAVVVRDEHGREVTGAFSYQDLQVLYSQGGFSPRELRLGPVPPGRYVIEAEAGGLSARKAVTVRPGADERKLTVRLKE